MGRSSGEVRIGTSGYDYPHWRRVFYPEELPKKGWFGHYASRFDTVEVNNTFYRLPKPETFDAWREQAPRGFCYALKFSRFGTHIKRLRDPEEPIERFFEGAERLGDRLGPILVQLPPRGAPAPDRLAGFLRAAPREHRFVVELRDERWLAAEVFEILRKHGAALCIHDLIEGHPREVTADFVYLRYHGTGTGYAGGYSPQKLSAEARRIRDYRRRGLDVYAYFNNDVGGHAPADAATLRRYVGRG